MRCSRAVRKCFRPRDLCGLAKSKRLHCGGPFAEYVVLMRFLGGESDTTSLDSGFASAHRNDLLSWCGFGFLVVGCCLLCTQGLVLRSGLSKVYGRPATGRSRGGILGIPTPGAERRPLWASVGGLFCKQQRSRERGLVGCSLTRRAGLDSRESFGSVARGSLPGTG